MKHETHSSKYYYEKVNPSQRYPILVYYHAKGGLDYWPKHWHRSLEICCFMSTPITAWINGTTKEYLPDDLIIISYGDVHEIIPHVYENPRGVSLIFPYEFLIDYSIKQEDVRFVETAGEYWDNELRKSLHTIVDLYSNGENDPYYHLLVNSEIFRVLHILVTHYCVHDEAILQSLHHLERCKEILAYIDNNSCRSITLESLANELGLSTGYLARYFNKYLSTTFKKHLTSVRVEKAREEIIHNDKTLLDISMETGFPDYRSFIKYFKKSYKITPNQYRIVYREKVKKGITNHSHARASQEKWTRS